MQPPPDETSSAPNLLHKILGRSYLVLSALIAVLFLRSLTYWAYTQDDAWITLRYAKNFIDGHGLVFNVGGARIEGYSNPLLLFLSSLILLTPLEPIFAIKVLSGGALILALLATYVLARRFGAPTGFALLAVFLVGTFPGVTVWAYSGLETMLYMALVAGGTACLVKHPGITTAQTLCGGLLLGLAAWTRIEGGLYGAIAGLAILAHSLRTRQWSPRLLALVPIAIAGISLIAFRLGYYGRLLPNTYYCKSGGFPWEIVNDFTASALPIIIAVLMRRPARWRPVQVLVLVTVAIHIVLYKNGSNLVAQEHRHFLVVVPLLAALAGIGLSQLPARFKTPLTLLLVFYSIGYNILQLNQSKTKLLEDYIMRNESRFEVVDYLKANASPTDQVLVGDVGIIGYYTGLPLIDSLCLVDEYYIPCFNNSEPEFINHALAKRRPRWIVFSTRGANPKEVMEAPEIQHYAEVASFSGGIIQRYQIWERTSGALPYIPLPPGIKTRPCVRQ